MECKFGFRISRDAEWAVLKLIARKPLGNLALIRVRTIRNKALKLGEPNMSEVVAITINMKLNLFVPSVRIGTFSDKATKPARG